MSGWPGFFALAVLAITLAGPAAGHDASKPAWFYCYSKCIAALEKAEPPKAPPPDALDRLLYDARESDGGAALERFKTCNNLCKGIQQ